MRAHRCGKTPDTMRSTEMRKRRSEALPKTCRRAEDALPYSTLERPSGKRPRPRATDGPDAMMSSGHSRSAKTTRATE